MNFYPRRRRKPEVIIVSLIDIFAILLIFVIVTTTFRKPETEQPAVTIKLPDSKTAVVAEKGDEALKLSIAENEEIFLGRKKVSLAELRTELEALLKLPSPPKLALNPDKRAPIGSLIAVLDVLKQAGVKGDLAAFTEPVAK